MDVHVDGYRSTDENWIYAQNAPSCELPDLSPEEQIVAGQLGMSAEAYARSRFAGDRTRKELQQRAEVVGQLVNAWLRRHSMPGEVKAVWLKTFQGKFRVQVQTPRRPIICFLDEEVVDGVLDSGSMDAQHRFERVLDANFGVTEEAQAS